MVLGFKSSMKMLLMFYFHMKTINYLIPKIFGCVFLFDTHSQNKGKLDSRAAKCIFVEYTSTQKGYKCYHPPSKFFFASFNVTFNKSEIYFPTPRLQVENSIKEDKDQDSFLIDPFSINLPKVSELSIPLFFVPESSVSSPKPIVEQIDEFVVVAPKDRMTRKVFLRKKATVSRLIQVQKSKPDCGDEVIVSCPPLQTEPEFHEETID